MKALVIAIGTAALLVSPAFAQKRHPVSPEAAAAQAYVPNDQELTAVDRYTVVVNNHIVGRDPDPYVRLMIKRDPMADGP